MSGDYSTYVELDVSETAALERIIEYIRSISFRLPNSLMNDVAILQDRIEVADTDDEWHGCGDADGCCPHDIVGYD